MEEQQILDTPLENGVITYLIDDIIYCAVYAHDGQFQPGSTEIYVAFYKKFIPVQTVDELLLLHHCGITDGKFLIPEGGIFIPLK